MPQYVPPPEHEQRRRLALSNAARHLDEHLLLVVEFVERALGGMIAEANSRSPKIVRTCCFCQHRFGQKRLWKANRT